jgi:hypothetical protein
MTISHARKLLGKEAVNLSDEEVQRDIDAAEFLKSVFFDQLVTKQKKSLKLPR